MLLKFSIFFSPELLGAVPFLFLHVLKYLEACTLNLEAHRTLNISTYVVLSHVASRKRISARKNVL